MGLQILGLNWRTRENLWIVEIKYDMKKLTVVNSNLLDQITNLQNS